jgi:hypothetical protein
MSSTARMTTPSKVVVISSARTPRAHSVLCCERRWKGAGIRIRISRGHVDHFSSSFPFLSDDAILPVIINKVLLFPSHLISDAQEHDHLRGLRMSSDGVEE